VTNNCLLCHSADYVATQPQLTRAQWQAGVEKMRGKFGAPIKTNDVPALVEYLTKVYGK
jgi:sulfite dehydrogenase